jgi:hypothetical protein
MPTRFGLGLLALVPVTLVLTACGESGEAAQRPARPADVRGIVTKVDREHDRRSALVIDRGEACELVIYLEGDTELLRASDSGELEARIDDLAVGQTVDVWAGAIAESCPEQTQAEAILIVDVRA